MFIHAVSSELQPILYLDLGFGLDLAESAIFFSKSAFFLLRENVDGSIGGGGALRAFTRSSYSLANDFTFPSVSAFAIISCERGR